MSKGGFPLNNFEGIGREGTRKKNDGADRPLSGGPGQPMSNLFAHPEKYGLRKSLKTDDGKSKQVSKEGDRESVVKQRDSRRDVGRRAKRSDHFNHKGIEIERYQEADKSTGEKKTFYKYQIGDRQIKAHKKGKVVSEDYETSKGRRGRVETIGRADDPARVKVHAREGKYTIVEFKMQKDDTPEGKAANKLIRGRIWYLEQRSQDWAAGMKEVRAQDLEDKRKKKLEL